MIRYTFTLSLVILTLLVSGQTLDEIRSAAGKGQWQTAKEGIDRYLATEANTKQPEGWYVKSLVYYNILISPSAQLLGDTGHVSAFSAYKKYIELKEKTKDTSRSEHEILFGLSFNNIDKANNEFRAKRYPAALKAFREVEEMENYIVKKGLSYQSYTFPAFDTQLYVNIAASAINAGREDIAVAYYQKIADNKIASAGFEAIYRYLVDRFDKKGDKATRNKYIAAGKELYPADPYWCQVSLREAGGDRKKLMLLYEELITGSCNNYLTNFNYAVELYNYAYTQPTRPSDFSKVQDRIPVIIKNALAASPTAEANLLMCRYQLTVINDLIDKYNAMPAVSGDKGKQRQQLNAQINQRYEEVLQHATNAINSIDREAMSTNAKQKQDYITACKILADYWERKGDKAKVREYQEKWKGVE